MILLALFPAFACPSPEAEVERATLALIDGDIHASRVALDAVGTAFACGPIERDAVVRYWIMEAALAQLAGGDPGPWLAAAHAVSDDFDARLGPRLRATWEASVPAGVASLRIEPETPASVDGTVVLLWPLSLAAGPHIVQVIDTDRAVLYARALSLSPSEDAVLPTGLPPEVQARLQAEPLPREETEQAPVKKSFPALLVVAAGAAAAGGGCAAGAFAQNGGMTDAAELADVEAAHGRQQVFAYAAYGLWAAAGVTATLHFVLP